MASGCFAYSYELVNFCLGTKSGKVTDPSNRRFANVNNVYVGRTRETICQKSALISLFYVRKISIGGYVFTRAGVLIRRALK